MPSLFTGSTFEVFAGPEKTRFVAHTSVLGKSENFRAVTRGIWKDSSECKIVLEEWDPETVGRLLEWLYTGDYESHLPTAEASHSEAEVPTWSDEKGTKPPQPRLTDVLLNKEEPKLALSHGKAFELWAATYKQDHGILNCEATLFAHAKLYALADYVLLPALQAQVFQRLKAVLIFISPSADIFNTHFDIASPHVAKLPVIQHIITFGEYVYANTTRTESEEEPLRKTHQHLHSHSTTTNSMMKQEWCRRFLGQEGEIQD